MEEGTAEGGTGQTTPADVGHGIRTSSGGLVSETQLFPLGPHYKQTLYLMGDLEHLIYFF